MPKPAKKSKTSSSSSSSKKNENSTVDLTLHRCGFVDWAPSEITSIAFDDDEIVAVLRGKGTFDLFIYVCVCGLEKEGGGVLFCFCVCVKGF